MTAPFILLINLQQGGAPYPLPPTPLGYARGGWGQIGHLILTNPK